MNGRSPLNVKRSVVFRHAVLAIRIFSHLDIADGVATLLNVGNLSGGIFRRAVKEGDGNHRGQVVSEPTGEENVKAGVLVSATIVYVLGGMPRINGRNAICSFLLSGIFRRLDESAVGINCACNNLLNGIADAIANIG